MGFGPSFYGFFIAAAIWMALYFVWAFAVDERVNDKPEGLSPRPPKGLSPPPPKEERPR